MSRSHEKRGGADRFLWLALTLCVVCAAHAQDGRKVPISFLPPPLETATYSLGIYDTKNGKLVRRLQEAATESAFTVGLNGLITNWDGRDDAGKAVPSGRYAARGYAVGELKVEGVDILGNDWANDDENLRPESIASIAITPADDGLAVLGVGHNNLFYVACYERQGGRLLWSRTPKFAAAKSHNALVAGTDVIMVAAGGASTAYRLADGAEVAPPPGSPWPADHAASDGGKDGSIWKIEEGVLAQYSAQGERLRSLGPKEGDPIPLMVAASKDQDRLYLLEATKGWQRVRGLSWVETKEENGKPVSTWQTFFERNIHPVDPSLGSNAAASPVETALVENPLDPGKPQKAKLRASCDDKGSYLTTADGLRLRRISQRANLTAAKVAKGKTAGSLVLFQSDGAAWDEFSIEGVKNMMEFDAGEIDMTADGEKTHPEKAAEPPDL